MWRRREIENHFLDPPFLVKSEYFHLSAVGWTQSLHFSTAMQALAEKLVLERLLNSWVLTYISPFSSAGSLVAGGETATFPGALIQN